MKNRHLEAVPSATASTPATRSTEPSAVFVGRDRELTELVAGLEATASGNGRLALLAGEPGIGKTRLLEEVAFRAPDHGVRVLWGRCWEGSGAPEYWPWVQVFRAQGHESKGFEQQEDTDIAHLGRLVPELAVGSQFAQTVEQVPAAAEIPMQDAEQVRFALLDAAVRLLHRACETDPLAILLDDLHSADISSLLLLRLLASQLAERPIFVVGTYRDTDARQRQSVSELLGELLRWGKLLPLVGLQAEDVGRLIEGATGTKPPETVTGAVHRTTEGNPFYVDELMRLLEAEGRLTEEPPRDPLGVPEGVRAAIRRRVGGLTPETAHLLRCAAVAGRDFDPTVVATAAGVSSDVALEALEEAVTAGVIRERGGSLDSYSFIHALVTETIYDDLPPGRRRELHRGVGQAMERLLEGSKIVTELAHHFYEAAPEMGAAQALPYLRRASKRATALLAYEDAAIHGRRALELAERAGAQADLHCELLLELGEAETRAGDQQAARSHFEEAAEIARRMDDTRGFARAALGYGAGLGAHAASAYRASEPLIRLLEEALARLVDVETAERVRVMSRLAVELYTTDRVKERDAIARQAVELARRLGDPRLIVEAMLDQYEAMIGPDSIEERVEVCPEIVRLAHQVGDKELIFQSHYLRLHGAAEVGAFDVVDEDVAVCTQLAEELRIPIYRWQSLIPRMMLAYIRGSLDEADRLNEEAFSLRDLVSIQPATSAYWGIKSFIRFFRGGMEEVEPMARTLTEQAPNSFWKTGLPFVHAAMGVNEEARTELRRAAAKGFRDVPRGGPWSLYLCLGAQAAGLVGEKAAAAAIYEELLPQAERFTVSMRGILGPNAVALGIAAATIERWDEAGRHFESALELCRRAGNRTYEALTLCEYGAMLLARGDPGDAARARPLLDEALALIDEFGFEGLRSRTEGLRVEAERLDFNGAAPQSTGAEFRLEGDYWRIWFGREALLLKDTKGLHYLAELLRRPGREVHVLDLVAVADGVDPSRPARAEMRGARGGGTEAAIENLDPQARSAYRARLEEMEEEIADAEAFGDRDRAASLHAEQEFVAAELARSLGLGGHHAPASGGASPHRGNERPQARPPADRRGVAGARGPS